MLKVKAVSSFSDSKFGCVNIEQVIECNKEDYERIKPLVELVDETADAVEYAVVEDKAEQAEEQVEEKEKAKPAPKKTIKKKNNKSPKSKK